MGCWNGTCGISQMPILAGDKVVFIPLVQNSNTYDAYSNGGGVCYSDAYFVPFAFPIVGIYNDYGCIELFDDDMYKKEYDTFLTYFQYHILENNVIDVLKEHSDNALCVDNANDEVDTLGKLLDLMERGRLKLKKGRHSQKSAKDGYHISFMLIHYDLYVNTINEFGNRIPYSKEYTIRHAMEGSFDALMKEIKDHDPMTLFFNNSRIYEQLKGKSNYYLFTDFVFEKSDLICELKSTFIDFICIQFVFDLMRKLWVPQAGAGSQSQEYMLSLITSNFIKEKIDTRKKELLEYNDDEELSDDRWMRESIFYFS